MKEQEFCRHCDKINYIRKISNEFCLDLNHYGELKSLNNEDLDAIIKNCKALENMR